MCIKKFLWDRRPHIGAVKTALGVKSTAIREEPRDIIITESASPVKTKVEEEKKEVAPVESTS